MTIEGLVTDKERALYGTRGARIAGCRFEGPEDGESALKECANLTVENCRFALRYPLWHVNTACLTNCEMTETCRAALWYDAHIQARGCRVQGIKAMRECEDMRLEACDIHSVEFGWFCRNVRMTNCTLDGEYAFLHSADMALCDVTLHGKYSFQYVENACLRHVTLNTKDAFWHSRGMTVYDSVIRGEYLGWYSENLRLVRCEIEGTQPLCYARGLVLEDCRMTGADLAFERSDVHARLTGRVDSVKNPLSGEVEADEIGQIIWDGTLPDGQGARVTRRAH